MVEIPFDFEPILSKIVSKSIKLPGNRLTFYGNFSPILRENRRISQDPARSQNVKICQNLTRGEIVEFWENCSISKKLAILSGRFLIAGSILLESAELIALLKTNKSFSTVCRFVEENF